MEGDGSDALKKRPITQSKKKGANKKGKWSNFSQDHHENTPNPTDTVYRILCPSRKIGSVIGKGGGIIKALREDTKAKISVSDLIPGSDDRVIMIYSPPNKNSKKESDEGNVEESEGNVEESMLPHCPAQDALMKVHDRILEEDLSGGSKDVEVTARLLVPHNMVGCLLGKGGDVIQRLRSETGANIRVLAAEHLPACALSTDELVLIQGNPMVVQKALYTSSTLLHQNPRKEKALNYVTPFQSPGFHPVGRPMINVPLSRNAMLSPRNPSQHMPPPPWMDGYASHPGFVPGRFDDDLTRHGVDISGEFSLKILCLTSKTGGVIGKGGTNVRQLQQETGASIHVEDASASSEERVIRVSAFETLRNPRSQTIDAILLLQSKASEVSDKGIITTRLLVPSNKVGCLLGQGGSVINEMRRRTQAEIRLCPKEDKPECASEDEELVQVSGSFGVAKAALAEIGSRLRARCLKDATSAAEPPPSRPTQGHGPRGSFPRGGPPAPAPAGVGTPGGYSAVKGIPHDHEPPSYPVHPSTSRFPNPNSSVEAHFPNSTISPNPGAGGVYSSTPEAPGTGMKLQDPYVGGDSDHFNATPAPAPTPTPTPTPAPAPAPAPAPGGIPNNFSGQNNPYQGSYPDPNGQGSYVDPNGQGSYVDPNGQGSYVDPNGQGSYPDPNGQGSYVDPNGQGSYPDPNGQGSYPDPNGQGLYQSGAPQQVQYQNPNQIPYQQNNSQQSPYQNNANAQHNAYQSAPTPTHGAYQY